MRYSDYHDTGSKNSIHAQDKEMSLHDASVLTTRVDNGDL